MSAPRPPQPQHDLDITIISAKHLKNVNWLNGDLSPYAVVSVDPTHRVSTKPDDLGSTRPVWNERFLLPLPPSPPPHFLTLEIFHSRPSDTPKPLVGSLRVPVPDPEDPARIHTFELRRPSGRPHGKIRLKLALIERPIPPPPPSIQDYRFAPPSIQDYRFSPPASYCYNSAPPLASIPHPPPHQQPHPYNPYSNQYSGNYPGYYPPQRTPRVAYGGAPSAPVDYNTYNANYDKNKYMGSGKVGSGSELAGAMGELGLEEKIGDKIQGNLGSRSDYSEFRGSFSGQPSAPVDYNGMYDRNRMRGSEKVGYKEGLDESDTGSRSDYNEYHGSYGYK